MTPAGGIEAIIELSKHSLFWYEEGDLKNNKINVVFKQINKFEQNMNDITEEVQMVQHKYKLPDEGRISKTEETLSTFIEESRRKQKENENLFWKIKKNYDKTLKKQAFSIKTIEGHMRRLAEIIHGREVGSLPSFTKRLSINIPFIEALEQMPKYAKFMKDLLTRRGQSGINKALVDLGASISLMPYSMFLRLNLDELKPMHVFNKKISFEVGNETITFDLEKSMRFLPSDDDTCHSVDIIDLSILNHVQEILPSEPFDSILLKPINHHLPTKINSLWDDNEGEQDLINQISRDLEPESEDYTKPTLFMENMFKGEEPTTKLKDLPSHLEYAFLDNNLEFPVIISSLLSSQEKELLLGVLTKHKSALAWKVADIKGISPSFCTHKILVEDSFKPIVQPQRRLNPKFQDVVKAEIVKLLDAGLIYAIFDSPWVSPIHVVPKKGGIIVVTDKDNELVPTRTITGWRVCIDYKKLNDATIKDHFPLPLLSQL
ncbi:hypothetical protein Tco_0116818 [Tanacetum coccineum]